MTLNTRRPTGKAPWPITGIFGMEKSGKSFAAAKASASPLIDRTLWFPFGEDDPDEYGAIEGARFEIVTHDGTYRALLTAMEEALAEERHPSYNPAKPNLWVLDSGGRVWELIKDMAQAEANRRWSNRRDNQGKPIPDKGVQITSDLWNVAADRWNAIMKMLRAHKGPSIITARLGLKMVVNDQGEPTKDKEWKVEAHKSLPFDVGVIIEMHARGENYITGVRSLRFIAKEARTPYPDFSMHDLWTKLGLAEQPAGERYHTTSTGAESQAADDLLIAKRHALLEQIKQAAAACRVTVYQIAHEWVENNGHEIQVTTDLGQLELLRDDYRGRAATQRKDAVA